MENIEEELIKLQPVKEERESNDLEIFKSMKKPRKKKDKLFSEITSILDDDSSGDDDMISAFHFKSKKKKHLDDDEDLFDTRGKDNKKTKNIEAKFKTELSNLQRLLKDNETTAKTIQDVMAPILQSKARGSSKLLSDLIMALNSSNNNRLATIKEISSLKKSIIDIKIKMDKDNKDSTEGISQEQFGSMFFDQLFKHGRSNVIDSANSYNQDMEQFVSNTNGRTFEEMCNERLNTESNPFRSENGNKMIEYESRQPEVVIIKDYTGGYTIQAIDNEGNILDDYPTPTEEQLGKLIFNNDAHTCSDRTGRTYKVIEP